MQQIIDFVVINRNSLMGLGVGVWVCRRFSNNMTELEKNTQEKKLFDPLKAKAQIQVYKDIYNLEDEGEKGGDGSGKLRIMQSAQGEDLKQISQFFDKKSKEKSPDE